MKPEQAAGLMTIWGGTDAGQIATVAGGFLPCLDLPVKALPAERRDKLIRLYHSLCC